MRIVFMGTPQFAVASLKILLDHSYTIVAVVTSPDKPAGRGQQLQQSDVKQFALQHHLPVLQPANLKDEHFLQSLKSLQADLQIVVAFRMLPESVWNMPPLGTYNLHASLLPQYRGAAPINWAIINGEKESGVTSFKLQHEIDTGNILFQEKISISETMNAGELHDLLMETGAHLILKSVQQIESGTINLIPQTNLYADTAIKHAPKIFKEDCKINWLQAAPSIHNFIRGLSPYPGAWTLLQLAGSSMLSFKIYAARPEKVNHSNPVGKLFTDGKTYLKVSVKDGFIYILEWQMAGKKKLPITEFLKGFSFPENSFFT